jgi:hypothetical protein
VRAASPSAGRARADGGERAEGEAEVTGAGTDGAARCGEMRVGQRNGGNTPLVPDAVGSAPCLAQVRRGVRGHPDGPDSVTCAGAYDP